MRRGKGTDLEGMGVGGVVDGRMWGGVGPGVGGGLRGGAARGVPAGAMAAGCREGGGGRPADHPYGAVVRVSEVPIWVCAKITLRAEVPQATGGSEIPSGTPVKHPVQHPSETHPLETSFSQKHRSK